MAQTPAWFFRTITQPASADMTSADTTSAGTRLEAHPGATAGENLEKNVLPQRRKGAKVSMLRRACSPTFCPAWVGKADHCLFPDLKFVYKRAGRYWGCGVFCGSGCAAISSARHKKMPVSELTGIVGGASCVESLANRPLDDRGDLAVGGLHHFGHLGRHHLYKRTGVHARDEYITL